MDVIPVIDVRDGVVVHAVRGERARYQPLASQLAPTSEPAAIATGLKALYAFRRLYVADLDGITGHGRDVHLVQVISRVFPNAEIWLDAGTGSRGGARAVLAAPVTTLVIGSETLESIGAMQDIVAEAPARCVLSLDFRDDEFMGPRQLLSDPNLWPSRVIVMTLGRVGSDEGPELGMIRDIARRAGNRKIFAAGGIRDLADLIQVREAGATGALVATALHTKKISAGDLRQIAGR